MKLSKRFVPIVGLVFAVLAAVSGAMAAAPEARAECAAYECEAGAWCTPNPGENTYCHREDNSNNCKTKACSVE